MVRVVYKIDELMNLRHYEVVNLKQHLAKILHKTSVGKDHQYIHKAFTRSKNNFGNCTSSKEFSPYFMKENKYLEYSYDRQISGIKILPNNFHNNKLITSKMTHNNNYYDSHIQYSFFNLLIFPPGSRIIRIEPGTPLPKGAVPIPFRFEDESVNSSDPIRQVQLTQPNIRINQSENSTIDRSKTKKYRNNSFISNPTRPINLPNLQTRSTKSVSNPYSAAGFFPDREAINNISIPENTNIGHHKIFSPNLPNTSQTNINDTDSSTTVGSSSCDSFNIQIQISATH